MTKISLSKSIECSGASSTMETLLRRSGGNMNFNELIMHCFTGSVRYGTSVDDEVVPSGIVLPVGTKLLAIVGGTDCAIYEVLDGTYAGRKVLTVS